MNSSDLALRGQLSMFGLRKIQTSMFKPRRVAKKHKCGDLSFAEDVATSARISSNSTLLNFYFAKLIC